MVKKVLFFNDGAYNEVRNAELRTTGRFDHEDRVINIDESEIVVDEVHSSSNINDYDISIITVSSFWFQKDNPYIAHSKNCIRRQREILTSLEAGRTIVLLVEKNDDLLAQILDLLKIEYKQESNFVNKLVIEMPKFKNLIDRYFNITGYYISSDILPICSYGGSTCGFYLEVGKGKLYILPIVMRDYKKKFYVPLISELLNVISLPLEELNLPSYLNNLKIINESDLLNEEKEIINRKQQIEELLAKYKKIKSILMLKHNSLVDNLIITLNEMGIQTYRAEKYEEDLWITQEGNKEVILEVKGTNGNFTRKQLNDLDNHREENNLNENFPALLIVNTFCDATNLDEKNILPEEDTLKRAEAQNVKIMRTLDLFNLYRMVKEQNFKVDESTTQSPQAAGYV